MAHRNGNWRLDPGRLRYVPNGIDLTRFESTAARARPSSSPDGRPVIGTVASLREEKNVDRLIRAFRLIEPPAQLVIVGDGPARPRLEALVAELGLAECVHFSGQVADPAALYPGFDLFALSSD